MGYERQDSMYKAKHGKEPQELHPTLGGSKKKNTLDMQEEKRDRRRAMLLKEFNKIKKDPF